MKIIKDWIKNTANYLGYDINKMSKIKLEIKQLSKIKNLSIKLKETRKLIKKYPKNPKLFYIQLLCLNDLSDPFQFEAMQEYGNIKKNFLKESGAEEMNVEFIPYSTFYGSLGNYYSFETLINANEIGIRDKKKIFSVLYPDKNFTNPTLIKYFKDYVNFINLEDLSLNQLSFFETIQTELGICLSLKNETVHMDIAHNRCQKAISDKKIKFPKLNLKEEDKIAGEIFLRKMGLPKDAWYVCLHVREPGYKFDLKNQTTDGLRNSNPQNYLKAVERITQEGGYVFRIGTNNSSKFEKKKNLIDYAHSPLRTDQLDIFLLATCKFMIATSSGPQRIPSSFGVPVIFTNNLLLPPYFSLKEEDLYLPRLIKHKQTGKNLTLEEMTSFPVNLYRSQVMFDGAGLKYEEASSDDIDHVVNEMLNRIRNKDSIYKLTKNQLYFKKTVEDKMSLVDNEIKAFAPCSNQFLENKNLIS